MEGLQNKGLYCKGVAKQEIALQRVVSLGGRIYILYAIKYKCIKLLCLILVFRLNILGKIYYFI